MKKHLLLIGDLGVGINLIKNLCFLDQSFDCPWQDRYTFFMHLYNHAKFNTWYKFEHPSRFWGTRYRLDLSNSLDFHDLSKIPKTVFINHSAFWEHEKLIFYKDHCEIVFLAPLSNKGLRWQIRAFVEKNGIDNVHNFSFTNPEIEKPQYIKNHGLEEYHRYNLLNMYEICQQRRDVLLECVEHVFDTSSMYQGNNQITSFFNKKIGLDIPMQQSQDVYEAWHKLHWSFDETDQWEWA